VITALMKLNAHQHTLYSVNKTLEPA